MGVFDPPKKRVSPAITKARTESNAMGGVWLPVSSEPTRRAKRKSVKAATAKVAPLGWKPAKKRTQRKQL